MATMRRALLTLMLSALVAAAAASAHVTAQPDQVRRGSTSTITFTVPNERSSVRIVTFDVQLPAGVSTATRPPLWKGLAIAPGRTRRFRLALRFPDRSQAVQLVANERFADGTTDTFYPLVTLAGPGLGAGAKLALLAGVCLLALPLGAFFVGLARWLRS